jgi:hypothetical protein
MVGSLMVCVNAWSYGPECWPASPWAFADRGCGDGPVRGDRIPDIKGLKPMQTRSPTKGRRCLSGRRHLLSASVA